MLDAPILNGPHAPILRLITGHAFLFDLRRLHAAREARAHLGRNKAFGPNMAIPKQYAAIRQGTNKDYETRKDVMVGREGKASAAREGLRTNNIRGRHTQWMWRVFSRPSSLIKKTDAAGKASSETLILPSPLNGVTLRKSPATLIQLMFADV